MVPLFLALVWAAVLIPPLLRSRLDRDPVDSVGEFQRHLRVLESAAPGAVVEGDVAHAMPAAWAREARRAEILRRRQRVSQLLLLAMASTLIVGLIPGFHLVLVLHVLADICMGVFVYLLAQQRRAATQARVLATAGRELEGEDLAPYGAVAADR